MLTEKTTCWILTATLLGMALGAAGCGSDKSSAADFFPPEGAARGTAQFAAVQATLGAREDATLYEHHFDEAALNSLGEEKLQRMVPLDPDANVVVFADLAAGELSAARRNAVVSFLTARGVDPAHVRIEAGANPKLVAPAASGALRMGKIESGQAGAPRRGDGTEAPAGANEMK